MHNCIDEIQINLQQKLISLNTLFSLYPLTSQAIHTVQSSRATIKNILQKKDNRMLVIIGPCSIHDRDATVEYGKKLYALSSELSEKLFIVMRTYFEKPRTTIGWKGLIHDPYLNGKADINTGIQFAYQNLLKLNDLGIPTATEFLDPFIARYLAPLTSWCTIGARTSESQIHRELASSLDIPVGFKNNTDGNIQVAIDAMQVAQLSHQIITLNNDATPITLTTPGNQYTHIILRGSSTFPNYDTKHVSAACALLEKANFPASIMIDCSHGNSMKNHTYQKIVLDNVIQQRISHPQRIFGVMLESFLTEGKQNLNNKPLIYGQSITDACIGWDDTDLFLRKLAESV